MKRHFDRIGKWQTKFRGGNEKIYPRENAGYSKLLPVERRNSVSTNCIPFGIIWNSRKLLLPV